MKYSLRFFRSAFVAVFLFSSLNLVAEQPDVAACFEKAGMAVQVHETTIKSSGEVPIKSRTLGEPLVADFNQDGKADIAIVESIDRGAKQNLHLLLGNGSGQVKDSSLMLLTSKKGNTTNYVNGIQAGDFNGDGIRDLVAWVEAIEWEYNANKIGTPKNTSRYLMTYFGKGDGSFTFAGRAPRVDYVSGPHNDAVSVVDYNKDGKADLVFSDRSSIFVYYGKGNGSFSEAQQLLTTRSGEDYGSPKLLELNGDGILDIAYANLYEGSFRVYRGLGDAQFSAQYKITYPLNLDPNSGRVVDIIAFPSSLANTPLHVGVLYYSLRQNEPTLMKVIQFDKQGDYSAREGSITLPKDTSRLYPADLSGNTRTDLVGVVTGTLYPRKATIALLRNDGKGSFGEPVVINEDCLDYSSVVVKDMNGDGKADFVIVEMNGNLIQPEAARFWVAVQK